MLPGSRLIPGASPGLNSDLSLPVIAVMGSQSVGKTSVLESLVGRLATDGSRCFGWMVGRMNGWMEGRMAGWLDGWLWLVVVGSMVG